MTDFRMERQLLNKGFHSIAGVDEVGRGALFGPVVSVSVAFPQDLLTGSPLDWMEEIDDSKSLSPKKRYYLAKHILFNAQSLGIGFATHTEIDKLNIYKASLTAMKKAVINMPSKPDFLLIDGFQLNDVNYPQIGVLQGDRKCSVIAAASIVAKVLRDEIMHRLDKVYPGYGLGQHKGYATRSHYESLERLGPTALHRRSFRLGKKNQD
jgi:ribonuclease HII